MAIRKPRFYHPKTEALALINTCRPQKGNNDLRKYVTLLMVVLWVSVAFLNSIGVAEQPQWFRELGYLLAVILGRMWQIEATTLNGSDK